MQNKIEYLENRIKQLESEINNLHSVVSELKILNEIAITAGRTDNVDQTLKLILNKTINAVNAEHGAILLVSENKELLKTFISQQKNSKIGNRPRIREHIMGWVLVNKKSLLVENLSEDNRFISTTEEKRIIKSLICSPIWFEGKIIGILQMLNKKSGKDNQNPFTENDLTLLSIISVQAGQLIKNFELQKLNFEKKHEAEMSRLETEKLHEIDKLKTNFFTNLSHEFRTPLTLILGPIDKIESQSSDDKIIKEASIIKKNSKRLLQLVNQLLDLSKLEAGKLKLEASIGNIVSFVKGMALSFESLSEEKDINLKIISEKNFIEIYFDKEKMIKILSNILSNAFKFTEQNGKITVSIIECSGASSQPKIAPSLAESSGASTPLKASKGFVEIKIRDTGIGIPQEEIPLLFDRFYQVDSSFTKEHQGTGLGLALTKELVELHHGKISVRSEKGKWTEFTLCFPLGRYHLTDEEIISDEKTEKSKELVSEENYYFRENIKKETGNVETYSLKEKKTIVLLVEDNYDMREYIKESLGDDYFIEEAVNGEQGIRKAERIIPDLIISDMIMPKMDGNEMTRILKNNEKTSHVPVIILTAKSGSESKLEGLETGADDYLTKPFGIKELQVRIKNLINIRTKLQEKFRNTEYVNSKVEDGSQTDRIRNLELKGIDERFINKVLNVIEENISKESFNIEELGNEVGMSRAQFYRKLLALTGMSPSIYLRSLRLIKAKKMIEEKHGNIAEIAFSVGFSSPSYFSKCFKDEFGYTPSDFIN